ncbi:MAG: HAMP domain-containing protein [Methylobacterium sp.]|nr:HAMP domain-containing protein [Methylobacterium sp.]
MMRLLPDRVFGQVALLIVGVMVLVHLALPAIFFLVDNQRGLKPAETIGRIAGFVEMIDRAAPGDRPPLIAALRNSHPQLDLGIRTISQALEKDQGPKTHLEVALGPSFVIESRPAVEKGLHYLHAIRLQDGMILSASEPFPVGPPPLGPALIPWLFLGLTLLVLALWTGWRITRPLQEMTHAVRQFQPGNSTNRLAERGPYEMRALADAFNAMQARIDELLRQRMLALAALSHDLRTPITRMRLRAEFMLHPRERQRMTDDLDIMDQLTRSVLDYLRGHASIEAGERIDLESMLHTLADRFDDEGRPVTLDFRASPVILAKPLDLERALANILENAFRHATPPTLRLREADGMAIIEIEDRGPGIPDSMKALLLRPFTRGDAARSLEKAPGFGLGLTIASEAVARQGGRLALLDAKPQGLLVRIEFRCERAKKTKSLV